MTQFELTNPDILILLSSHFLQSINRFCFNFVFLFHFPFAWCVCEKHIHYAKNKSDLVAKIRGTYVPREKRPREEKPKPKPKPKKETSAKVRVSAEIREAEQPHLRFASLPAAAMLITMWAKAEGEGRSRPSLGFRTGCLGRNNSDPSPAQAQST